MSEGKIFVDWAREGAPACLVNLLRGNDEITREVRDYLADVVSGKEKIRRVKMPIFSPIDVQIILVTWHTYTNPDVITRARTERRKNLYGPKRAIADLIAHFEEQKRKVSEGVIMDVVYSRKTYAGLYEFEMNGGKWSLKFVKEKK